MYVCTYMYIYIYVCVDTYTYPIPYTCRLGGGTRLESRGGGAFCTRACLSKRCERKTSLRYSPTARLPALHTPSEKT